jgi:hypothetical protein
LEKEFVLELKLEDFEKKRGSKYSVSLNKTINSKIKEYRKSPFWNGKIILSMQITDTEKLDYDIDLYSWKYLNGYYELSINEDLHQRIDKILNGNSTNSTKNDK